MPIISPTAISPHRIGGAKNWSSYWKTHIMPDGHTVAWYDVGDGSATYMTKDGSNLVSQWNDLSGNNNHLLQANASRQMTYTTSGLYSGGAKAMQASFTIAQPMMLYFVFHAGSSFSDFFDGIGSSNRANLAFNGGYSTTNVFMYAGTVRVTNTTVAEMKAAMLIYRVLFNGANSFFKANANITTGLNPGNSAPNGITLNNNYELIKYSRGWWKELIVRNCVDNAATEAAIVTYLQNKYSVFF